ncbi:MAG: signal peptidase II [Leptolyngbya sp. PLA3]|nr:MAG: signal peptidase II [Cyanobacteria bacterium CYA]MCE7968423.1 signal peptidase II [Leptolyngbya sp. PL-A3]
MSHAPAHSTDHVHAYRSPRAWALLMIVTGLGLATDLATKSLAFAHVAGIPVGIDRDAVLTTQRLDLLIPTHKPVVVIPNLLELTLVLNPGAVFGVGAGRRWFFVAFTLVALAFATFIFGLWTRARDMWAHVAIGLIAAGGLGNLYDRLRFACVRDFIHPLPGLKLPFGVKWPGGSDEIWPYVSNVADLYLIVGIAILLLLNWSRPKHAPTEPTPR